MIEKMEELIEQLIEAKAAAMSKNCLIEEIVRNLSDLNKKQIKVTESNAE